MIFSGNSWIRSSCFAVWLGIGGALSGCGSVYLHDETKAALGAEAKTKYQTAGVRGLVDAENENLTALLENELTVVRANRQQRLDLRFLSIAADRSFPMTRDVAANLRKLDA